MHFCVWEVVNLVCVEEGYAPGCCDEKKIKEQNSNFWPQWHQDRGETGGNVMSGRGGDNISVRNSLQRGRREGFYHFMKGIWVRTTDPGKLHHPRRNISSDLQYRQQPILKCSLCHGWLLFWNVSRKYSSLNLLEVSVQFACFADEVFIMRNTRLRRKPIIIIVLVTIIIIAHHHKHHHMFRMMKDHHHGGWWKDFSRHIWTLSLPLIQYFLPQMSCSQCFKLHTAHCTAL